MHSTLTLHGTTARVRQDSKDFSTVIQKSSAERVVRNIQSEVVTTTLQESKAQEIAKLLRERELLIEKRNSIIDSPIKYFIPFYRKKLREIDADIDVLDLQLFSLETEDSIKESDLDTIISTAEARLKKYSKYLNSK
jgi:hypothetical protein